MAGFGVILALATLAEAGLEPIFPRNYCQSRRIGLDWHLQQLGIFQALRMAVPHYKNHQAGLWIFKNECRLWLALVADIRFFESSVCHNTYYQVAEFSESL